MRIFRFLAPLISSGILLAPALAQYGNICPGGSGSGGPGTGSGGGGPVTGGGNPRLGGGGGRNTTDPPVSGPSTGSPGTSFRPGDLPSGPSTGGGPGAGDGPSGPSTPSAPASAPSGPTTGSGPSGGPTGLPSGPSTRVGLDLSLPLDAWDRWWAANRERFLDLRTQLDRTSSGPVTGEGNELVSNRGLSAELRARVGEHLLAILEGRLNVSSTERDAALLAAAKLGFEPARTRQALQAQLSRGTQSTRELAALSLGVLGEAGGAPLLVALAKDLPLARSLTGNASVDSRTRSFAIYGLGLLARKKDLPPSIPRLARETLLDLLGETASLDVAVAALSALGILPTGESERWTHCYPALEQLLLAKSSSDTVRAHIPTAVARLDGKPWGERFALIAENDREHPLVRASAVLALGRCGDELQPIARTRALRSLEKACQRTDGFSERAFALLALAQIGDGESLKRFEREVVNGAHLDQPWLALGLGLAARAEGAEGKDGATRIAALSRALRAAKAPETRGAIAIALALTKSAEAIPDLRKAFAAERIARTRGHLAVALGLLGDTASATMLREALKEARREPEALSEIATALGLLRDHEAVPALVALLKDASSTAELGPLARALGRIGDARAADALLALATDAKSSQIARTYAIAGLGVIFDEGPLPWSAPYTEDINYLAATPSLFASGGLLDLL